MESGGLGMRLKFLRKDRAPSNNTFDYTQKMVFDSNRKSDCKW